MRPAAAYLSQPFVPENVHGLRCWLTKLDRDYVRARASRPSLPLFQVKWPVRPQAPPILPQTAVPSGICPPQHRQQPLKHVAALAQRPRHQIRGVSVMAERCAHRIPSTGTTSRPQVCEVWRTVGARETQPIIEQDGALKSTECSNI
jgi:hypothetical protein